MIWFLALLVCGFADTAEVRWPTAGLAFEGGVAGLGVPFAWTLRDRPPTESEGSQGYLAGFAGLYWRWSPGWETGLRVDRGAIADLMRTARGETSGIGVVVRLDPLDFAWIRPSLGAVVEFRNSEWEENFDVGPEARGSRRGLHLVLEPELRTDLVGLIVDYRWPLFVRGKTHLQLGPEDFGSKLVASDNLYAVGLKLTARVSLPLERNGDPRILRWNESGWERWVRVGVDLVRPQVGWVGSRGRAEEVERIPSLQIASGWCLPGQDRWGFLIEGSGLGWDRLGSGEGQILASGMGVFYQHPLDEKIRFDVSLAPGWVWGEQTMEGSGTREDGTIESWGMRGRWDAMRTNFGFGIGGSIFRVGGHVDVDWMQVRELQATLGPWSDHVARNDGLVWNAGAGAAVVWSY